MSSTQTPPPPKTPLWCIDWLCVQNFGAKILRLHFVSLRKTPLFAVSRAVEGSEGSAAGGRYSDPSEWQRSVFSEERRRRRKIPGTATGSPAPTNSIEVQCKKGQTEKVYPHFSFFIFHFSLR